MELVRVYYFDIPLYIYIIHELVSRHWFSEWRYLFIPA
jgi:hypothetical protein